MSIEVFIAAMIVLATVNVVQMLRGLARESGAAVGVALIGLLISVGGLLYGVATKAGSAGGEGSRPGLSDVGDFIHDHMIFVWPILVLPLVVLAGLGISVIRRGTRQVIERQRSIPRPN